MSPMARSQMAMREPSKLEGGYSHAGRGLCCHGLRCLTALRSLCSLRCFPSSHLVLAPVRLYSCTPTPPMHPILLFGLRV